MPFKLYHFVLPGHPCVSEPFPIEIENNSGPGCMIKAQADMQARIKAALERADIKTWELFRVDNCGCEDAPLGIPEKEAAANPLAGALMTA